MLTSHEIMLIRVALILRLEKIKSTGLYQEHKDLLGKLWALRDALSKPGDCPLCGSKDPNHDHFITEDGFAVPE